jgi:hypothetical protein
MAKCLTQNCETDCGKSSYCSIEHQELDDIGEPA